MKTLFALLMVLLFVLPSCAREKTAAPVVGNKAPSFTLKDIDGKAVRLSDFAGKVVLVDFWATWCSPCQESMAELEQLHRKYRDRGVVVLGISMDTGGDAASRVRDFANKHHLTYLMLMDDKKTSASYAVYNIPATYLLDRDHRIVKKYPGYKPGLGKLIADEIEKLLP
jgi:cytochrome c biogenesis protein CcmG, thiol:disulfide interchange protein DsbE